MKAVPRVHGTKGVYCGGDWLDIEDSGPWLCRDQVHHQAKQTARQYADGSYDVVIVGAGCIGSAIARELSKTNLSVMLLERDDDVTQGATKGNSGIVHAGYDDKPNTNRARFCWKGNQMFAAMDRDLRFGYLQNGSLVVAQSPEEEEHLKVLYDRGQTNGIQNLRIIGQAELRSMEPHISPNATAALYSPDAGTVTPYEYTIALAENAADNGVEIRTRHEVVGIERVENSFVLKVRDWTPRSAVGAAVNADATRRTLALALALGILVCLTPAILKLGIPSIFFCLCVAVAIGGVAMKNWGVSGGSNSAGTARVKTDAAHPTLAFEAGSAGIVREIRTTHVINSAGLFADKVAAMVGDTSFKIKPRLGDYLLLHKNQGHLAH